MDGTGTRRKISKGDANGVRALVLMPLSAELFLLLVVRRVVREDDDRATLRPETEQVVLEYSSLDRRVGREVGEESRKVVVRYVGAVMRRGRAMVRRVVRRMMRAFGCVVEEEGGRDFDVILATDDVLLDLQEGWSERAGGVR